jgi:hypothetical protein
MFLFTPRKIAPLTHICTVHCYKPPQLSADLNTEAEFVLLLYLLFITRLLPEQNMPSDRHRKLVTLFAFKTSVTFSMKAENIQLQDIKRK